MIDFKELEALDTQSLAEVERIVKSYFYLRRLVLNDLKNLQINSPDSDAFKSLEENYKNCAFTNQKFFSPTRRRKLAILAQIKAEGDIND